MAGLKSAIIEAWGSSLRRQEKGKMSKQPTVYIPQVPSRYDRGLGAWVPTVTTHDAERFGKVVVMLPPEASRLHVSPLLAALRERMSSFGPEDYLLAMGDPTLLAAAAVIASRQSGGDLRLLKWDRMSSSYILVECRP